LISWAFARRLDWFSQDRAGPGRARRWTGRHQKNVPVCSSRRDRFSRSGRKDFSENRHEPENRKQTGSRDISGRLTMEHEEWV
jgi:hypothetical protein